MTNHQYHLTLGFWPLFDIFLLVLTSEVCFRAQIVGCPSSRAFLDPPGYDTDYMITFVTMSLWSKVVV